MEVMRSNVSRPNSSSDAIRLAAPALLFFGGGLRSSLASAPLSSDWSISFAICSLMTPVDRSMSA